MTAAARPFADHIRSLAGWLNRAPARRGIAAAALSVLAALTVVRLLDSLGMQAPVFLLLAPAILLGAALGGLWPGLGGTLLGLATGIAASPKGEGADLIVNAILFALVGVGISFVGGRLHEAIENGRQVNEALRRREAHQQSILDTVPDAMVVIDAKGVMLSFSAAAERLFRMTAADALGRNVSILMPQPYRDAHDAYIERYLRTQEKRIIGVGRVVVGQRSDGSTFPMELAVGEVRRGDLHEFTGFIRDLTESQATQKRLQELQSELVHISRLTAMGEMASSLAHELNQPLSAIANYLRGASRLMEQTPVDTERLREPVEKSMAQAIRAGEVIRRLRAFVATGETEHRPEDLAKMIEESLALALVGVRESSVRVRTSIGDAPHLVMADKVQVQQVLLNLIRNAVEALQGVPNANISVLATADEHGDALIRIIDSGPGVAPSVAAKLFQPFMTTKPNGMGVGLSICRTIVEAHGGRLWHEETPGGGATFALTLPAVPEAPAPGESDHVE